MDKFLNIYLKWDGRISRMTYWVYSIPIVLLFILNESFIIDLNENIYLTILLFLIHPSMMINIKRSHDRGKTGFFSVLLIVPIVSLWPLIEFGFIKGDEGANKYGEPDKTWANT